MRLQSILSIVRLTASLLLVVVYLGGAAISQPTAPSLRADVPLSAQLHRDFYLDDGLPSNWINDVVQTRDGYLWIATDNGVVRYDGIDFKSFSQQIPPQFPSGEIRKLYESRDGHLWIGTTMGLARYRPGRPGKFEEVTAVSGTSVHAIFEDDAGTVWIGTQNETYARRRGLGFEIVEDAPKSVRAICQDHSGTLWIGSHFGLFRRQGESYEQITHERLPAQTSTGSGIPQTRVNVILPSDDGSL